MTTPRPVVLPPTREEVLAMLAEADEPTMASEVSEWIWKHRGPGHDVHDHKVERMLDELTREGVLTCARGDDAFEIGHAERGFRPRARYWVLTERAQQRHAELAEQRARRQLAVDTAAELAARHPHLHIEADGERVRITATPAHARTLLKGHP